MANTNATQRQEAPWLSAGKGEGGSVKALVATVELAASSSGDTVTWGYIPSNARILPPSTVYWDDLTTTGSPTLDTGLGAVNSNLANSDDPDALANGGDVTSAGSGALFTGASISSVGLPAWDFVASESSDPGGSLKVYSTVKDAATTIAATVSLVLYYRID